MLRLRRQRNYEDYDVGLPEQIIELAGWLDALPRTPRDSQELRPEGRQARFDRLSDGSVAHDENGVVGDFIN